MTTMRRRAEFKAELRTLQGAGLGRCYAMVEIETTLAAGERSHDWRGRLTSLSNPEHSLSGTYLLRPAEGDDLRIEVVDGAAARLGVTSDEYAFRGQGDPPPAARRKGRQAR